MSSNAALLAELAEGLGEMNGAGETCWCWRVLGEVGGRGAGGVHQRVLQWGDRENDGDGEAGPGVDIGEAPARVHFLQRHRHRTHTSRELVLGADNNRRERDKKEK